MNKTLSIFALGVAMTGLTCCQKESPDEASTGAEGTSSAPLEMKEVLINSALSDVAANIHPAGVHYSITNTAGDAEKIVAFLDQIFKEVAKTDQSVPAGLSFETMARTLGLLEFTGKGSSTTPAGGKGWHNRSYFAHKGQKVGLMKLLGENPKAWQVAEFAPAGADIVLETSLDLRRVMKLAESLLTPIDEKMAAEVMQAYSQEIFPGAKMTIGQLMDKVNVRGSIAVTLDQTQMWEAAPGVKVPAVDVIARLDGVGPFWPILEQNLGAMLPKEEEDGFIVFRAPGEMPVPFGKIQPALAYDSAKQQLWVRLKGSPLDDRATATTNLASSDEFKAATQGFPAKGSSLFYISQETVDLAISTMKNAGNIGAQERAIVGLLLPGLQSFSDTGYGVSACVASQDKGLLLVMNGPLAFKGGGGLLPLITLFSAVGNYAMLTPRTIYVEEPMLVETFDNAE